MVPDSIYLWIYENFGNIKKIIKTKTVFKKKPKQIKKRTAVISKKPSCKMSYKRKMFVNFSIFLRGS